MEIERVRGMKYLGVWLTDDFKLKKHIDKITKEYKSKISLLWRIKDFIGKRSRELIYDARAGPKLNYCTSVLGEANGKEIRALQKGQVKFSYEIHIRVEHGKYK